MKNSSINKQQSKQQQQQQHRGHKKYSSMAITVNCSTIINVALTKLSVVSEHFQELNKCAHMYGCMCE